MGMKREIHITDFESFFEDYVVPMNEDKESIVIGVVGGRSVDRVFSFSCWETLPLERVKIFFGDERKVPLDSLESNYQVMKKWFSHFSERGLPAENVYPYVFQPDKEDDGLGDYQQTFDEHLKKIDILILAVGEDGHVLSLFPGHDSIMNQQEGFIAVSNSPKPPAERISISRKMAQSAETAIVLFLGEQKKMAYENFKNPSFSVTDCPAKLALSCTNCIIVK